METAALAVASVLLVIVVSRLIRPRGVPVPIARLVVGTVLSFVPGVPELRLSPEVVLLGLLPPLLYSAAISTSLLDLRAHRLPILGLSVGLVLFTAFGVALAMIVASGTFQWWWPNSPVPLAAGLVDFPTTIGRWELRHDAPLAEGLNSVDFDQKLVRGYATADGEEVTLLLGYLSKQVQGRELAGQSMLAGTGLSGFRTATIPPAGRTVMKEFVANKGAERFYVVYAYILDGTVIAGDIDAKIRTTWNVLTERRSNGGVMLVAGKIGSDEEIGTAGRRVRDFVEEVMPQSAAYLAGSR